jgi:hypothetical protein
MEEFDSPHALAVKKSLASILFNQLKICLPMLVDCSLSTLGIYCFIGVSKKLWLSVTANQYLHRSKTINHVNIRIVLL